MVPNVSYAELVRPCIREAAPKTRLADRAYNELLRRITAGQLAPSQRLTEHYLCALLKMSRTPVRQALHRLVADGLLTARPHHSVSVRALTTEEILELYLVREAIECEAARLAAERVSDAELKELYDLCDRMESLTEGGMEAKLYSGRELDAAFHNKLVELSGVKALADLYKRFHILQLHMFGWHISRLPDYVKLFGDYAFSLGAAHRPIVDAIAARDPVKAERAIRQATRAAMEQTRRGLAQLQQPDKAARSAVATKRPARSSRHVSTDRRET